MTNPETADSQPPLRGVKLAYTPIILFLMATIVAPAIAQYIVIPFMRTPELPSGNEAYRFNDALIRLATVLTVGLLAFGLSYSLTSFERPSRYILAAHARQASLVWVYLLVNVLSSIAETRSHSIIECYACSLPWTWVAPPALAGNLLALVLRARLRKVAA